MYLIQKAPFLYLFLFSLAPLILGFRGYKNTRENEDRLEQTMKGAGIGLLFDMPFLCYILLAFSFS